MYIYLQSVNEIFLRLKESNTMILFVTGILITVPQPALEQSATIVFHRSLCAP